MKTKKSFLNLGLYLIISLVFIVAAVVVALTAGFKLGTDFGGGSQITITCEHLSQTEDAEQIAIQTLKDNGVSYEKVIIEDHTVNHNVVIRIADKDVQNQSQILTQLEQKLTEKGLEVINVSDFEVFGSIITNRHVLYASLTIVCLLLAVFIAGLVRYKISGALTLIFAILHTILMALSLIIVTRVPLSLYSLIAIICAVAIVLFAVILLLEKVKENSAMKLNETLPAKDLVNMSNKSALRPIIVLASLFLIASIIVLCIPVRVMTFTGISMISCLVVAMYTYFFVTKNTHIYFLDLKKASEKARLSKNNVDKK